MEFVALVRLLALAHAIIAFDPLLDDEWKKFQEKFKKNYTEDERHRRRLNWEEDVKEVKKHNLEYEQGKYSYYLGTNEFSDMSHEEFLSTMTGLTEREEDIKPTSILYQPTKRAAEILPQVVDWREKGLVTPVKNQGACRSCWAFAAIGSLEGQQKKRTGKLVKLSVQNLVDCTKLRPKGNRRCYGSTREAAFEYVKKHGIDTESSYPYEAKVGNCRFNESTVAVKVTKYVRIKQGDEYALQNAVAKIGPISVDIDSSPKSFLKYKGGIHRSEGCSTSKLNHAVLVIGYGTDDGEDYWLVKNSWGKSWGIGGYAKMSRNKKNQCGIANRAIYPEVESCI